MMTIVYKIGGSLLDLPDLARRVELIVSPQSDGRPLFVVGGGPTANIVREWDRVHQLGRRWKTVRWPAVFEISWIAWTPLAPVPTTATRLPLKSIPSLGQRPVWRHAP